MRNAKFVGHFRSDASNKSEFVGFVYKVGENKYVIRGFENWESAPFPAKDFKLIGKVGGVAEFTAK